MLRRRRPLRSPVACYACSPSRMIISRAAASFNESLQEGVTKETFSRTYLIPGHSFPAWFSHYFDEGNDEEPTLPQSRHQNSLVISNDRHLESCYDRRARIRESPVSFGRRLQSSEAWQCIERRSFSTIKEPAKDTTAANKKTTATQEQQQRTDPDFAEYLTKPETDPITSGPKSTTFISQPHDLPLQDTHQALTNETEQFQKSYKYVRRRQQNELALSRQKAVTNVQRALIGNVVICVAKFGAWVSSGSSSMLSELVHSVVDCGNQSLLLIGLRDSTNVADRKHPYGYGKAVYFWALVSALGTFFLGAGVSGTHAIGELMEPSLSEITWQVWGVLVVSFAVDGWVFTKTVRDIRQSMPEGSNTTFLAHLWTVRDPALLAVLLEDGAACLGIVMAIAGIAASHATGMPVFDGLAGVGISALLAAMGIILVRVNHRFLLGHAVDSETIDGIQKILLSRRSIDNVHSVQSQWTGPDTFSYKAEVDFDGTYLAAKLMPRYQTEFLQAQDSLDKDLRVLLSWYAEDVMRTVEREVRSIEAEIRKQYPGAEFIELEPMSKEMDRFAIDDGMEAQLRRFEIEALNRYLKSLYPRSSGGKASNSTTSSNPKAGDEPPDDTSKGPS
jgi:zinc transporter 9